MYCASCGTENDDKASYCTNCGNNLTRTASSARGGQPNVGTRTHVPNYLVQAILVTIFCCLPFGIVSIVYAAQVNGKLQQGDFEGAASASNSAKMWAWISLGAGIAGIAAWGLLSSLVFGTVLFGR